MKRIATIGAVVTAFAITAPVAAGSSFGGGFAAQIKQQVSAQVVTAQVANVQRAQAAIAIQRHQAEVAQAQRFSLLLRLAR